MSKSFVKLAFAPTEGNGRPRIAKGAKIALVIDGVEHVIPGCRVATVSHPCDGLSVLTLELVEFEVEQPRK